MAFEKNTSENLKRVNFEEGSNFIPKTIPDILKKVSLISDSSNKSSELDFHLRSYEEEMRKVDAFKRELPLCMQLLQDGIEKLKEEKLQWREREMGAVMDELIVAKSNTEGGGRAKMSIDFSEKKSWMSSVQLWSTPVEYENSFHTRNEDEPFLYLNSRYEEEEGSGFLKSRGGGAFLPFKKTQGLTIKDDLIDVRVKDNGGLVRLRSQQPHQQRKQRRCWSPELHRLFVDALDNLGGAEVATPKQIREQMKVEGLTNDEVKSHLQKYRIHIRRLASASAGPACL